MSSAGQTSRSPLGEVDINAVNMTFGSAAIGLNSTVAPGSIFVEKPSAAKRSFDDSGIGMTDSGAKDADGAGNDVDEDSDDLEGEEIDKNCNQIRTLIRALIDNRDENRRVL
ncbi:MAG: hypothetical protein M1831_004654 [Alyxoria varia]|nr:MAG: hypothetical protein M1831_004654 [Alyxoria varia]